MNLSILSIIWGWAVLGRLQTLAPRVSESGKRLSVSTTKDVRMSGSALQKRRLKLWTENPHCKRCGKLTQYPYGFELDHEVPLHKGGSDTEDNCQILCVDEDGVDGCHSIKTREDMKL